MAKSGLKNEDTKPFKKGELRRFYFHDRQTLAVHVDQLRRKHDWQNVRDWARGDFLSWYAASVAPTLNFKKICPAEFPYPFKFSGFEFDAYCYVFKALAICDQKSFRGYRDFFQSLKKENPRLYYQTIFHCIPSFEIKHEFENLRFMGIEDIKRYCVFTETTGFRQLASRFPKAATTLNSNGWDRSYFWDAVHIILKRKPLPSDFNPIESSLLLSIEDLVDLGYEHLGPLEI